MRRVVRSRRLLAALAVVSALPLAPAIAQESARPDPRLASRLDARTAAAVQATIGTAVAAGLPGEPLALKALEGASKGARGALIVAAVGRLHARLGEARQVLGAQASEAELVSGASALQAGVDPAALRALRNARANGSLATALSVLTDLVARGVPAATAAETVLALVRDGAADDQLVAFRAGVDADIGSGMPAAAAAAARQRSRGQPANPGKPPGGRPGGKAPPL